MARQRLVARRKKRRKGLTRLSFLAVREEQCVDLYLPARRVIL